MNQVTIQDIAAEAQVSKSTVSRVLNGTAVVNADKRQAVLAATKRLGFQPNIVARSLSRGRSMTIGVLTQLIGSPFYDSVAQGVLMGLSETDYSPIFVDGQWQTDDEIEAIEALLGRRVDGLILIGGGIPEDKLIEICGPVPTVIAARRAATESHCCVYMDNEDGGYRATRHLIDNGHRRIAMIKGLEHHPDAVDRFTGYQRALSEANIECSPDLVMQGDFSAEAGLQCVEELISRQQKFTAVFASNDITAYGARLALHRHKLRVPDDVSLVGFDDQMESAFTTPPLTTVKQPAQEIGRLASKGVLARIEGEPFESQVIRGELIKRETVAAAPVL